MPSIEAMLRAVPGFDQLSIAVVHRVASVADVVEAPTGEVLFREGALPEALFVLLDGRVTLTGTAADSTSAVIDIMGPNSSFVLANVLTNEPYLVGAEAVTISTLIRIAAAPMRAAVTAEPAAAMAMMRAMSAELGAMTRQVVDLKVRIAAQRLGTYLLQLVHRTNGHAGRIPPSGEQGPARLMARVPRGEPVARLPGFARLRRRDPRLPRPVARHRPPAGLCRSSAA